jgi:hypothetical protein
MAVWAASDSLMTLSRPIIQNVLFRIAMPNAKSAATGSITVQKRTTSISRKLLIKIAFIPVGAYLEREFTLPLL